MNEKLIEKQSNQLFVSVVGAYLRVNSSYYRPVYYSKCLINHLKVRLVKLSPFHKLKKKKNRTHRILYGTTNEIMYCLKIYKHKINLSHIALH